MKLGFVSAILPEYTLEQVLRFAHEAGLLERRADVLAARQVRAPVRRASLTSTSPTSRLDAIEKVQDLLAIQQVAISGLGYYPNPLSADAAEAEVAVDASPQGDRRRGRAGRRAWSTRSSAATRPCRSRPTGRGSSRSGGRSIAHAESRNVQDRHRELPDALHPRRVARRQEPGDLARRSGGGCSHDIPSPNFGLNFDPSHFIWQQMDYLAPLAEFRDRIFHVHAKDARIDRAALDQHGVLSYPKLWHTPKIPGLGDVRWGAFFGALSDIGYDGARRHRGRGPGVRRLARGAARIAGHQPTLPAPVLQRVGRGLRSIPMTPRRNDDAHGFRRRAGESDASTSRS